MGQAEHIPNPGRVGLPADPNGQDLDASASRSPDWPYPAAVTVLMLNTYRHITPTAARRFAQALTRAAAEAEANGPT